MPAALTFNEPFFFNNTQTNNYLVSNYNLGESIKVANLNETGGFNLDIQISALVLDSNAGIEVPYTDIGILTFNNSPTSSMDGKSIGGSNIQVSTLDPVERGVTQEPFSQQELTTLIDSGVNFDDYYTYFSGNNLISNPIRMISTDPVGPNTGEYQAGVSLIVILPENALTAYSIIDGNYSGITTFTLTSK